MKKLETIKKNLEKIGITCDYITIYNHNGAEQVEALKADTNYSGLYPTSDTWKKIAAIRKEVGKRETQTRGHYTAVFIY